jgi:hypothetical protein
MEKILAARYAFCDFSDIASFPHPVPTIVEWDDYLPRFKGSKDDHLGEHLFNFHRCMLEHGFVHEDVLIKLFRFSLEEHARKWCQSLPAASISSLKDFHRAFNEHYKRYFSDEVLFENCCEEYELHDETGDINKEELISHNLHQFSNTPQDDTLSHEHEVEVNNPEVESSLATIIPDYYISEDLIALAINHMDQLSYIQMEYEISKSSLQQLLDLQTDGIVRNCEKQELQKSFNLQLEQQEDYHRSHMFCNKGKNMHDWTFSLNQYNCDSSFKDPMAVLLKSYLLDSLKISDFIMSLIFRDEYDLLKKSLWLLFWFHNYMQISSINEVHLVIKLLRWLLWKSTFT